MERITMAELQAYAAKSKELRQLRHAICELDMARCSPRAQNISGMPSAPSPENALELLTERKTQMEQQYAEKMLGLYAAQQIIEAAISLLPPDERMVMRERYIFCRPWVSDRKSTTSVCTATGYSAAKVFRLHRSAIGKIIK